MCEISICLSFTVMLYPRLHGEIQKKISALVTVRFRTLFALNIYKFHPETLVFIILKHCWAQGPDKKPSSLPYL